ncbi:MAG TPA: cysteine hydrolase [Streptosporangiaceae bacterium]|jgi:nicotinamidase-related amidase|nr:cysteine hydrolase [Streptosporangiaceae bacterium]
MSKEAVSNVSYPVAPGTTVLLTIDCQFGFGAGSWEQVPHADAAVENLRRASRAWRECGGTVVHVQTVYTPERGPSGRITDFEPGIAQALAAGTRAAEAYPGLVQDGDLVVYKTTFSAVLSSDLVAQLRARGVDTVVTGGLTTPICVQTTVDGLSMTGLKVIVLADACASQGIGTLSAEAAHEAAISRMAYLFAAVQDTDAFVAQVRALQPAAG